MSRKFATHGPHSQRNLPTQSAPRYPLATQGGPDSEPTAYSEGLFRGVSLLVEIPRTLVSFILPPLRKMCLKLPNVVEKDNVSNERSARSLGFFVNVVRANFSQLEHLAEE